MRKKGGPNFLENFLIAWREQAHKFAAAGRA
jgi:hypothetical protein